MRRARSCPTQVQKEAERPLVGDSASNGVIDPDVIWSCTNCGACVEECPVDIEHIDHIAGMRRHQVLIESAFPAEASADAEEPGEQGRPVGHGRGPAAGLGRGPRLRGAGGRRPDRRRRGVPVLGRLRRRAGGPGPQDDQGDRAAAAHRRGLVRGARPGRDLHRGPGQADGQRVRVHDAGAAERRDAERGESAQDRGQLPALLQHARARVPPARRELRGDPPHPAAGPAGGRGQANPGEPDRGEDHLPRPVLPRPAQPGVHRAAPDHGAGARRAGAGDAPVQGARVLLRGRRGADVDGGADRQADQRRADRGGAGHRPGHDLHRVPVLPGDARRRGQRQAGLGGGEGVP